MKLSTWCLVLFISAAAFAKTEAEIRQDVSDALAKHQLPDATYWRSLDPQTPAVIAKMAGETTRTQHKVKLVETLGYYDDAKSVSFLEDRARTDSNRVVRQAAIRAVARSQKMKEEAFFREMLESPDPQIRLVAGEQLKKMDDPKASQILSDHLKTESVDWIVKRLTATPAAPQTKRLRRTTSPE